MDARRIGALALAAALLLPGAVQAAFSVEATIDSATIGADDVVRYSVTARDSTLGRVEEPKLPDLHGFQILSRSHHTGYEFISGTTSVSISYHYTLAPPGTGDYVFEPAVVRHEGREYRTNKVRIVVVPGSRKLPKPRSPSVWDPFGDRRRPRREKAEVLTDISHETVFVGETIVLTYRLRTTMRLVEAQMVTAPEFPGFLAHESSVTGRGRRVGEVEGVPLYEHILGRYVLIPLEAGEKGVPAQRYQLKFRVPDDGWGLSLFNHSEQVLRTAEAKVVAVRPLPAEGMPNDYAGAVGRFSLESSVSGNRGQVGEAMNLRLKLTGTGNFPQLGPPDLTVVEGFKFYEPKTETEVAVTTQGLSGDKVWEYVILPEEAGARTIPPIRFPYFDPKARAFRTARTRSLALEVAPAPVAHRPPGGIPAGGAGFVPSTSRQRNGFVLKPLDLGALRPASRPYETWWFWALGGIPLVWLAGAATAKLVEPGREQRAGRRRVRRARSAATSRLRAAKARLGDDRGFLDEVDAALLGYFADKTERAASSLSRGEVRGILKASAVADPLQEEYGWIADRCDYLRFAPDRVESGAKKELLERVVRFLRSLDRARFSPSRSRVPVILALALALLVPAGRAGAAEAAAPGDPALEAVRAYNQGRFGEAAAIYRGLLREGGRSAALHHNLAVALYGAGERGRAILHLEKALRVDPLDSDARHALSQAREEMGLEEPGGRHVERLLLVVRSLVSPGLASAAALLLWWITAVGLSGRVLWRRALWPRVLVVGAGILFLVAAAVLAAHIWADRFWQLEVLLEPAELRSGPSAVFPALEVTPEGATGRLMRRQGDWVQIDFPTGLSGWLPASSVGPV